MTPRRAILVALIDRYLTGLLDPSITIRELHKLMYFMQEAGEPLRLSFQKADFGPYAENLRHVLNKIEGHDKELDNELALTPKVLVEAKQFLVNKAETQAHLDRVSDLVDGFESPFGMELLSTVHWVATRQQPLTVEALVTQTYDWSPSKRKFNNRQIRLAYDVLTRKGWCAQSG